MKAKARLVEKGFKQKHGVDYLETFSPTANAASIRLIVALAFDWELLHLDIEQAFVQSELDHEVFMKLPQGCGSKSGKIVRLNKSCMDFGRRLEHLTRAVSYTHLTLPTIYSV